MTSPSAKGTNVRKPRVVATRTTEGPRPGPIARGQAPRGRGGRPKGSKTKPKGLVPLDIVQSILGGLEPVLPPDQMRYLKGVIKDGHAIDTKKELDTLILLVNRSIWPALANEALPIDRATVAAALKTDDGDDEPNDDDPPSKGEEPKERILRRDVTDRLKVLNSFLTLRANLDKQEKAPADEEQPILKLFAQRGMDTRIAILMGESQPQIGAGEQVVIDPES